MKIAYLTSEYPHPSIMYSAGIGTSIFNLAKGLHELGHDVIILVYSQDKDEILMSGEAKIYKIKNVKCKGMSWWLTRKKIEKTINRLCKEKAIDILEAPDWTGITSFMTLKCPLIIKLHGSDTYFCYLEKRPIKWINKFHEKQALKRGNAHISVSQYTADVTNNIFNLDINFKIIPNGIDTNLFAPICRKENKRTKILYLGTLIRKKGVFELPFIFNKVIEKKLDVELILIGKDAYDIKTNNTSTWSLCKSLFSETAIKKVSYLGSIPYKQVKNYISQADVCVFPSFAEALPLSWLEAMSMEKVLVSSNIGWAREIINDNLNGYLVYPKNHNKFAKKIISLLNNDNLKKGIESNARKCIQEYFDNVIIARKSIEFYNSILDN